MEERKALFFDIDGTLFDGSTKSILPSTKKMLDELTKHPNYDLYLSTGRSSLTLGHLNEYKHYFRGLNLSNGQEIYIDGKLIENNYINPNDLDSLLQKAEIVGIPIVMILEDKVYANFFNKEGYDNLTSFIKTDVIDLNHQPFDLSLNVLQLWLFANNDVIDEFFKDVENLVAIKWGTYGADIIPKGSSKARGIEIIQKEMGYKLENMYAFGDGDNDAPMFKVVGTSVAMGNGSILAKENATMITDDIKEDGLFNSVKKLNLI